MSYISLFRKYRSEDFDDLVGQEHIVRTISNAIRSGKIAQGYLFCGTRGTGKTTVARIIAKALNCEKGPTDHPCGECSVCRSIKEGSCIDVVEMDAASNRSVEDVEKIVDSVRYRPVECRYKVYIIDEAHQLSNQAKDAFLKTLEEPPEYVVFILATTEAHKIPVTIRSRCQQFDFKRGTVEDISGRIKYVCEKEGVSITDEAVKLVARNANGSYRDSLSILEQIIAFSGNSIAPDDVYGVLGLVEEDILFRISKAILENNIKEAFEFASYLMEKGKDIKECLNNISAFYRDLLAVKIGAEDLGPHYKSECGNYTEKQLADIIGVYVSAQKDLRLSDQQRLTFELAFIQAGECLKKADSAPQIIREVVVQREVPSAEPQKKSLGSMRVIQDTKPAEAPKEEEKPKTETKRVIDFDLHIRKFWPRLVDYISKVLKNPQFATCLSEGVPTSYENDILTITFKYGNGFRKEYCERNTEYLEKTLLSCYKIPIKVKFESFPPPPEPVTEEEEKPVPPPNFAAEAGYEAEVPKEEIITNKDLEAIDSATVENSSIKNLTENKKEELFSEENSISEVDGVMSDNPLTDTRLDKHPKYEEIRNLFPDAKETTEEN